MVNQTWMKANAVCASLKGISSSATAAIETFVSAALASFPPTMCPPHASPASPAAYRRLVCCRVCCLAYPRAPASDALLVYLLYLLYLRAYARAPASDSLLLSCLCRATPLRPLARLTTP